MADTDTGVEATEVEGGTNPLTVAAEAFYTSIRAGFLADHEGLSSYATALKEVPAWDEIDVPKRFGFSLMLSITMAEFCSDVSTATEEDYAAEGEPEGEVVL